MWCLQQRSPISASFRSRPWGAGLSADRPGGRQHCALAFPPPQPAPALVASVTQGVAGMRIGRVTDLPAGAEPEVIARLNEAFAAQVLACTRKMGLADNDPRINPNGGAIALGHPLGMSGSRILLAAAKQLQRSNKRYALVTMCIGVGQGYAAIIERV